MRIAGVWVGLSAQLDNGIRALGAGARDAERLHACFADANDVAGVSDEGLKLRTNETATVSSVQQAIEDTVTIAREGACDFVHIHFSCHGSPNGELLLFDSLRRDRARTSLPLSWISDQLAQIQSADVVVTLDTCFSGTVLGMPASPNENAFLRLMHGLSGESRSVMWAAGTQEPAYESPELGHGYLTYGLLNMFERFRAESRTTVPITAWLQGALDRAQELLNRDGYPQNPGAHIRTRAGAVVVVPTIGTRQRQYAVLDGIHPVSSSLASLHVYGFTDEEITAIERPLGDGALLNELQQRAISIGGALAGQSILVRAPTTAGKTLIGELAILRHHKLGRKAIVLSPMRALVSEQVDRFRRTYGLLGLRVVQSTGEFTDDDDLLLGNQFEVAFATYEKFAALLSLRPKLFDWLGVVVADELQLIGDVNRGAACELLMMRIKRYRDRTGLPQIVALCNDSCDISAVDAWLGLRSIGPVARPIPLREGVLGYDGTYRYQRTPDREAMTEQIDLQPRANFHSLNEQDQRSDLAVRLTEVLVGEGKRVLLFVSSQKRALELALMLGRRLGLPRLETLCTWLEAIPVGDRHRTTKALLDSANRGVGIHTAALDRDEKAAVEAAFRDQGMQVLVATTTLSMGVNLPADACVIVDTSYWRGPDQDPEPVDRLVCRNMAGRAGRLLPNGPAEGSSYLIARNAGDSQRLWATYVVSSAYPLQSALTRLPPADHLVSLIGVVGDASTVEDVATASRETLSAFQGQNQALGFERADLHPMISELAGDGIVNVEPSGRISLTDVGAVAASRILQVESVRRIRRALQLVIEAGERMDALALLTLTQLTAELEDVYVPGDTITPSIVRLTSAGALFAGRRVTCETLLDTQGVVPTASARIVSNRFRRLQGLIAWLRGGNLEDVENKYQSGSSPVLSHLKAVANRTEDLLLGVSAIVVAERPEEAESLRREASQLRARLEVGGSAAAGRLYRLRLGLTRRQCLDIVGLGIQDVAQLEEALKSRREELEALLSSSGIAVLQDQVDRSRRVTREGAPDQLLLELLSGPEL